MTTPAKLNCKCGEKIKPNHNSDPYIRRNKEGTGIESFRGFARGTEAEQRL